MANKLDDIKKKIAALFAKAESSKELGSLEEAEVFATKAQELLVKYQLEMADVQQVDPTAIDKESIDMVEKHDWNKNESTWLISLYNGIAKYNFCQVIIQGGTGKNEQKIWLIGEEMNRDMVKFIAHSVIPSIRALRRLRWIGIKDLTHEKANTFMRGYLRGAATGIQEKLRQEWEDLQEKSKKMDALVRTNQLELRNSITKMFPNLGHSRGRSLSGTRGNEMGRQDGRNMSIKKGVGGASSRVQKRLN